MRLEREEMCHNETMIAEYKVFLEEHMDPDFGLLDKLRANGTIDWREKDEVTSERSLCRRNSKLLEYILTKGQGAGLIAALRDADQMHIVNYLTANGEYSADFGEEWPLRAEEISILDASHGSLVDLLELTDLLGLLYSSKVINRRQMDSIFSKPTSHEKNDALLEILRRRSLRDYRQTITCLYQSQQRHIAEILETGGVIVRTHARLDGENVDEAENEIATTIAGILIDKSVDQRNRILGLVPKVIAAKIGQSIVLYIYCKTIEELQELHESLTSGRLKDYVESWFNSLLNRTQKIVVAALTVSNGEFQKIRMYFKDTASDDQAVRTTLKETMALERRAEEAKPYDVVIDTFINWHASYVESAQMMIQFATSFESELKKAMKFLVTIISTRNQLDGEQEILSAYECLMHSTQMERTMSPELSSIAKLLVKLAKRKETETLLFAMQTNFDKYSELQKKVLELRKAYKKQDVTDTSEYLSLHKLVIKDNQQFPETELLRKATLCLRIMFHLSARNATLPDDVEHDANSRETANVNHELTLNRIKKILPEFFEDDMIKAEHLARLWPSEIQEAAFSEVMEIVSQLKSSLERWVTLRRQTIEYLREMSMDLHDHNKNVAISKTVASSTGIVATVLGVIGIALTPVTFVASLSLLIAAGVLGGAAVIILIGITIIKKHPIYKTMRRTLEELINKEKEELEGKADEMRNQEIDTTKEKIRTRALKDRLFHLHLWVQANKLEHETSTSTNETNDTRRNTLRITFPVVYYLDGAGSGALRILAPFEAGAVAAGAAARVTSRLVFGLGGALTVITLPVDTASIVSLANELKDGAKGAIGEEFARMADTFEDEMKSIQSLLKYEDKILTQQTCLKRIWGEFICWSYTYRAIRIIIIIIVIIITIITACMLMFPFFCRALLDPILLFVAVIQLVFFLKEYSL